MTQPTDGRWFRRRTSLRTTWLFRVVLIVVVLLIVVGTRGVWVAGVGGALVCQEASGPADAMLIENFDQDYLLFERAAALQRADGALRVLVPTPASPDSLEPNLVSAEIVDVMAGVARLQSVELIPFRAVEPITLNAAYDVRDFLQRENLHAVLVLSRGFRSQRAALVYGAVFGEAEIVSYCVPVFGQPALDRWTETWHGVQQVVEQHVKLQYYRFYVMPRLMRERTDA